MNSSRALIFIICAFFSNVVLCKNNDIDILQRQIFIGNAQEVDSILTKITLSTEQEEDVRNTLYQYSYLMNNLELARVFDKFFFQPEYANNASLLFNRLCSNDFIANPSIRDFVDWLWEVKVKPSFTEKSVVDSFLNGCLEESLGRGNFNSITWLRDQYINGTGFNISSRNHQLISEYVSQLNHIKDAIP